MPKLIVALLVAAVAFFQVRPCVAGATITFECTDAVGTFILNFDTEGKTVQQMSSSPRWGSLALIDGRELPIEVTDTEFKFSSSFPKLVGPETHSSISRFTGVLTRVGPNGLTKTLNCRQVNLRVFPSPQLQPERNRGVSASCLSIGQNGEVYPKDPTFNFAVHFPSSAVITSAISNSEPGKVVSSTGEITDKQSWRIVFKLSDDYPAQGYPNTQWLLNLFTGYLTPINQETGLPYDMGRMVLSFRCKQTQFDDSLFAKQR